MKTTDAESLTDAQLVDEVGRLAGDERRATVALIVHLAEFDARQLAAQAGFSSTQKYCMAVLRLSEDAAYNRIHAARVARRYPIALEMMLAGELNPTTARMLERHLTPENHRGVLAAAAGKSKEEVEELVARLSPKPDVPDRIRALPDVASKVGAVLPLRTAECVPVAPPTAAAPPQVAPSRPIVRPLAPERYEIRFTARVTTRDKLREAQDLLSHVVRNGDIDQVVDRALTLLIADLKRKKYAAAARPRPSTRVSSDGRVIPSEVRRAVDARDGGRCAYVSADGLRCDEPRLLEFHHVIPRAAGGKATVDNIQIRCRAHSQYEAKVYYGPLREYVPGDRQPPFRNGDPRRAIAGGG